MPPAGHKAITVTTDTWRMIEELRQTLPLKVSQGELVRAAIIVLFNQKDPLALIARSARSSRSPTNE